MNFKFDDKDYDTHNAVTTGSSWVFTAPLPGKYSVSVLMTFDDHAWVPTEDVYGFIRVNSSSVNLLGY